MTVPDEFTVTSTDLEEEFSRFYRFRERTCIGKMTVEVIDPHGMVLRGRPNHGERRHDLVLMALVHGDETGGLVVLNEILELIETSRLSPNLNLVLLLGNVEAARSGKRFLERDMNRSFSMADDDSLESKRASLIEDILHESLYSLDIHQTIEPTKTPFFVFKYSEPAAKFARRIAPKFPSVVYQGTEFSAMAGMSSDEFAFTCNCTGVSLEIGKLGIRTDTVRVGMDAAIRTIEIVENEISQSSKPTPLDMEQKLYSWAHVEAFPDCHVELQPDMENFDFVSKGQVMGYVAEGSTLRSPIDGLLLFPKYVREGEPKPLELYRLLKIFDGNTINTEKPGKLGE